MTPNSYSHGRPWSGILCPEVVDSARFPLLGMSPILTYLPLTSLMSHTIRTRRETFR